MSLSICSSLVGVRLLYSHSMQVGRREGRDSRRPMGMCCEGLKTSLPPRCLSAPCCLSFFLYPAVKSAPLNTHCNPHLRTDSCNVISGIFYPFYVPVGDVLSCSRPSDVYSLSNPQKSMFSYNLLLLCLLEHVCKKICHLCVKAADLQSALPGLYCCNVGKMLIQ